jgi:hypothetical protein
MDEEQPRMSPPEFGVLYMSIGKALKFNSTAVGEIPAHATPVTRKEHNRTAKARRRGYVEE